MMSTVEVRQLCKTYRAGSAGEVRAVSDVSLEIATGSFVLLAGPSGSGKTTLLSLIGALERPTSGQVLIAGRSLGDCSDTELTRIRRRIGFVFQDSALIFGLHVWENMTYPLIPRGVRRSERLDLARELLERLGVAGKEMARPGELSGGELQRIAIGRALIGQPELILADEPTSNLDEESAAKVIELLHQVHTEGKTIVVSSHDPRIESLATQVFRLAAGIIS
jgi:putative ABC transport system ATP-binding protein